jgi:hypothetical protein
LAGAQHPSPENILTLTLTLIRGATPTPSPENILTLTLTLRDATPPPSPSNILTLTLTLRDATPPHSPSNILTGKNLITCMFYFLCSGKGNGQGDATRHHSNATNNGCRLYFCLNIYLTLALYSYYYFNCNATSHPTVSVQH